MPWRMCGGQRVMFKSLFRLSTIVTGIELKSTGLTAAPLLLNCPTGLSVFSEEFLDPKANAVRNQRLLRAWWHHWPGLPDCSGESQASLQTQRGHPGEHLFGNWEDVVPVAPTHLLRAEGCDGNKSENHLSTWGHCLQPAQLQAACVLWLMESLQTFRELSRRVLKSTCSFKIALARKFLVLTCS